jgi:response regulator RpfG family c-di-GMP phosphodiesterase
MPLAKGADAADQTLEILQSLEGHLAASEPAELARVLEPVIEHVQSPLDAREMHAVTDVAVRICRLLHVNGRSREALVLAHALLARGRQEEDTLVVKRAASACGLLYADIGDVVTAIEHFVEALRAAKDDRLGSSGIWSNIGLAMGVAANYEMASRCYQRALAILEGIPGRPTARHSALSNLAQCQFETGAYEEGLVSAYLALQAESENEDPMNLLRLRRNLVRLLVAVGRVEDAEPFVVEASILAQGLRTPRAAIAATVALTRLDNALAAAREVPAALRETLACVARAEEMAGHSERALLRVDEIMDHVYGPAVEAARRHIELASLTDRSRTAVEQQAGQARARLISRLAPRARPDGWSALERLGVTATMRMEPTGWHGKRVGALAKALAMAAGTDPLQSLEIGFACEVHDIGMLSVPEEMLAKRGVSAEIERSITERHVKAGAEILSDDAHPRIFLAREVVRYHHASWDGSGYPERVAGKRIPFAARACAVADAYDDLVCGVHGTARASMDDALAELRAQAGRRFDPELVDCFESMIRAETDDLGLDRAADSGMENFQQLVTALQEDRGFI